MGKTSEDLEGARRLEPNSHKTQEATNTKSQGLKDTTSQEDMGLEFTVKRQDGRTLGNSSMHRIWTL